MKNLILILSLLVLGACAHHKDVRPSADGVHKVVVTAESKEQGSRNALDQANHYCEQSNRQAAIVKETQNYTGDMDEQSYKNAKKAAKVAQAVGSAGYVFGGKKESEIGGVVGLGGAIGSEALGKGYTVEMRFKCM